MAVFTSGVGAFAMRTADDVPSSTSPGRDAAIAGLFAAEAPRLIAVAQILVGDAGAAEDLVQDAFVSLYRRWAWVRDKGAAADYLMGAVVKGSKHALRQRYSARTTARRVQAQRVPDVPSAESAALLAVERREVLDVLARLPMRQRQVVLLRYYAERSEQEIASILSISRGSVKRHASRALTALAQALEASP